MERIAGQAEIQLQWLRQNLGDGVSRIEAVIRVLEYHLDLSQIDGRSILNARCKRGLAMQHYVTALW
jgi:hypothetical protein